ncbi:MAG: diaminopimelate epimerase [Mobiluncus porci]|uniref:diaminopimelate epimerase n=2 Tax=Mobiluncus porci TaxID=2652278 RepID=UPI0023F02DBC|nr:diaminopimelate epimerase [Mobiluncus porci]MDD7540698.1 diaminopimelate epimerase [Mobiluncus porci]
MKGAAMRVEFRKMHGTGNDFVVIDGFGQGGVRDGSAALSLSAKQVIAVCDRHFGVGADGVIIVEPGQTPVADGFMNYINADGSLAQMCGNGTRVAAKWLVERGIVDPGAGELILDTRSGPKAIKFTPAAPGKDFVATVDMGEPILDPERVPVTGKANTIAPDSTPAAGAGFLSNLNIATPWGDILVTCVSMGNPHAIWFLDDWRDVPAELFGGAPASERNLANMEIDRIGKFLESNPAFPEKANIEFIVPSESGKELEMRVFERGVGETLACGTGACAAAVAAALTGRGGLDTTLHLRGGDLRVEWRADNHVYMTGPATESFQGVIEIPDRSMG